MTETKTFRCETPIKFNGDKYAVGDSIDLPADIAAPLLLSESVSEPVITEKSLPENVTPLSYASPPTDEEKHQKVVEVIQVLNKDLPENWLKDGRPDIDAIMTLVPFKVSAKMRDAAWDELTADKGEA